MVVTFAVVVGAAAVSSVGVVVKNAEDDDVADESEDASYEHVDGFFDNLLFDHAMRCFDKKFDGDDVDEDDVEESTKGLGLLPAEGKIEGTLLLAQPYCHQRYHIGQHV
jgi:hypothetical protein